MFEKDELQMKKSECKDFLLKYKKKKISILEFPIKQLFENTESDIEFIHKSIYEYFVSEYLYNALLGIFKKTKQEMAGEFARILKFRRLQEISRIDDDSIMIPYETEILNFLKYRIESGKLKDEFNTIHLIFELMIQDGMTFYSVEPCKNVIKCEMTIFFNMLEILHLWDNNTIKLNSQTRNYLLYNHEYSFNLDKVDLTNVNLDRIYLGNRINNAIIDIRQVKSLKMGEENLKKFNIRN